MAKEKREYIHGFLNSMIISLNSLDSIQLKLLSQSGIFQFLNMSCFWKQKKMLEKRVGLF